MKAKFCKSCGASLPEDAAFCPGCGRTLSAACRSESTVSDGVGGSRKSVSKKFKDFVVILWIILIADILHTIATAGDVREYYSSGQMAFILFEGVGLVLSIWLTVALMRCKSWARKTFIVFVVLNLLVVVFVFFFLELISNQLFSGIMGLISFAGGAYCFYLCFDKDVAQFFVSDAHVAGAQGTLNRLQCFFFWLIAFLNIIIEFTGVVIHEGTDAWENDCQAAIIAGSESARDEYVDYLAQIYAGSETEEPDRDAYWQATQAVDKFLEENLKTPNSVSAQFKEKPHFLSFVFTALYLFTIISIGALFFKRVRI